MRCTKPVFYFESPTSPEVVIDRLLPCLFKACGAKLCQAEESEVSQSDRTNGEKTKKRTAK